MRRAAGGGREPSLLGAVALAAGLALGGFALGGLAACSSLPDLNTLPSAGGLTTLPLRSWLVEGGIEAEAITACRSPDCGPHLAAGLFRVRGREARALEAALADPPAFERGLERLAAERRARRGSRRILGSRAAVREWRLGEARGVRITLARDDDGRAAHGIVLARRMPDSLRAAIVVGESGEAVEQAAERLARARLGGL